MNADRHKELIRTLQKNDAEEIPFVETKNLLLGQGYSEAEISNALYQSPYDGKKNKVKSKDSVTEIFANSPQLTEQVGVEILNDAKRREKTQAAAEGLAAQVAPGRHARAKYGFEFTERLGFPYFRILLAGVVIFVVTVVLELPMWLNSVFYVLVGAWISWTFYVRYFKK